MQNVEEQVNISWQLRVAAATALGLIRPLKTLEAKLKMASVGPRNTSSNCLQPFRNLSMRACIVNHASISVLEKNIKGNIYAEKVKDNGFD